MISLMINAGYEGCNIAQKTYITHMNHQRKHFIVKKSIKIFKQINKLVVKKITKYLLMYIITLAKKFLPHRFLRELSLTSS